jgi:tRNA(fMet)-specific endonuclease VapC
MKFMLDTNICIYIIRRKPVTVLNRLQKISISDICISTITLAELEYGIEKSSNKFQNRFALTEFLVPIEIIAFDDAAATKYGEIRAGLEKKVKMIGPYDMLIAAHALSLNLTIITNNISEFKRIPTLKIENWV